MGLVGVQDHHIEGAAFTETLVHEHELVCGVLRGELQQLVEDGSSQQGEKGFQV